MKKLIFPLLLTFLFLSVNAQEESDSHRNLTIKFPLFIPGRGYLR